MRRRRRGQTVEKSRRTGKYPRADLPGSSHDILRREIPVAACVAWAKHWSTPRARQVKEVVFYGLTPSRVLMELNMRMQLRRTMLLGLATCTGACTIEFCK